MSSTCRSSSVATRPSGPGIVVATSDQRVSSRRSSQGKSNSTASICVVSSIETWSTQSNTSLTGNLSRHSAERLRMLIASWSRWVGVNIGATVLRCAEWRGWSIAMKLSRRKSVATSRMVMPPSEDADENTEWLVSMSMISLYLVTDQYGQKMLALQYCAGSSQRSRWKYGQNESVLNSSGWLTSISPSGSELALSRAARRCESPDSSIVPCMRRLLISSPPWLVPEGGYLDELQPVA